MQCLVKHNFEVSLFLALFILFPFSTDSAALALPNDTATYTPGVGENLYPCGHNHSVCKQGFDCLQRPYGQSLFDRDVWACPPGNGTDCICQLIIVSPYRCGPDALPSSERLNLLTRTSFISKQRTKTRSTRQTMTKTASVRQKEIDTEPYQCPNGLRCVIVNPNRKLSKHECVSCNTSIPGMKYQLNDSKNCKSKTLDPVDGRPTALLQPCSPNNGLSVCDDDLECFSSEPYRSYDYRLRPCTASSITNDSLGCFCQTPNAVHSGDKCKQSRDCRRGYRCAQASWYNVSVCVSCQADTTMVKFIDDGKVFCDNMTINYPSPSPSPAPACIAVDALGQFKRDDLVFAKHIQATVLCDVHGNCATAGHMVMHKSKSMMMKSYCALASIECRYRIMFVNSPRMKIGMRIPSMSNDFKYTAFSARHESVMEEYVLSAVIRANF